MVLDLIQLLLFPALMAFAAANDLFTMTISNRISLLLIAGFIVVAAFAGIGLQDAMWHLAAAVVVLVAAFVCFARGWMGGGDAKLAAATALWFGFSHHLMDYLLYTTVLGGMLTLAILLFRQWPLQPFMMSQPWIERLHDKKTGIPYGVALAIGAMLIYPDTRWFRMVDLGFLASGS